MHAHMPTRGAHAIKFRSIQEQRRHTNKPKGCGELGEKRVGMTLDDDNSIYVGGLPYDCTEDTLRKVFDLYGHILAIKIINDHEVGGKCYGFVTYTNPRSAVDAISDMNGRTIGGRVVRVNEVKTRGGKPNRENFHRDFKRDIYWPRGRGSERDQHRDRYQYRDRSNDRSRDHEGDYEGGHSDKNLKEQFSDQGHQEDHDRSISRDHGHDGDQHKNLQRIADHDKIWDKDKKLESANRYGRSSQATDSQSRDYSSSPSGDNRTLGKEELDTLIQRRDDLQHEIVKIERKFKEKDQYVSELQKTAQKLENALAASKKIAAQRKTHLTKLQRSYMQVRDCSERLKSYEQELQVLVDTVMLENDEDMAFA